MDEIIDYLHSIDRKLSTKEIATNFGVSTRHARRAKERFNKAYKSANNLPNVLLLDIETAPVESLSWGIFKQYINPHNIVKDWSIICYSAKWLYDDVIFGDTVSGEFVKNRYDFPLMPKLHELLDNADIVIAHNAQHFDIPRINTRMIYNGFYPTTPYQVIDTLKVANKVFSFSSTQLDELAKFLRLPRKHKAPLEWWYDAAVNGSQEAVNNIFEYNKQDIVVLEEVYTQLRPWIKSHPNLGLYIDTDQQVCPNCGNTELTWKNYYYTMVGKYKAFQCNKCHAIGRSRFTELPKDRRKTLVTTTAR